MYGIEPEKLKNTLTVVIRWGFGVLFLLLCFSAIVESHIIAGLLFLLAAIIAIPPAATELEKKLNFHISSIVRFFVVFILIVFAATAMPSTNTVDKNTENVASPPSVGTDSKIISTPSETTTSSSDNLVPVVGTYYKCGSWSNEQYPLIRLFGEDYVPLLPSNEKIWNSRPNKLAKLILDLPSEGEKYALRFGERLDLGQGYTLFVKQVDVDHQVAWLEFGKDGQLVSEEIISLDGVNDTWTCKLNDIQGVSNIAVFKVHVSMIAKGKTDDIVQLDGLWLIDYESSKTLNIGDKFGEFTLTEINNGKDELNLGNLVFKHNIQNSNQTVEEITLTPKVTPTPASKVSASSDETKTTMQFSESKKEELIGYIKQYYGAKEVTVTFISPSKQSSNGLLAVDYYTDSTLTKTELNDNIASIIILSKSLAGESGIENPDVSVSAMSMDSQPLGVGNYYSSTGTTDIHVSDRS